MLLGVQHMKLNFFMEGAGLIFACILLVACSGKYNIIDFKDRIYVHLMRMVTFILSINIISCFIIRNSITQLKNLSVIIVSISFLSIVVFWFYLSNYLIEIVNNRNRILNSNYLIFGLPSFIMLLFIIANFGFHKMFDVVNVDGRIQVVFNSWYKVPYILVAVSVLLYLAILIKNRQFISRKKQRVFWVIPFVMGIAYYFQYRFKSITIIGYSYVVVLFLIYLYSYNKVVKIDKLTNMPDVITLKKMLDYRIGSGKKMTVAMITLDDFKHVNHEYGYQNGNLFLKEIAKYIKESKEDYNIARYGGDKFVAIFDDDSDENAKTWCDEIVDRFQYAWSVGTIKHKLSICVTMVDYPDFAASSEDIFDVLEYLNTYAKTHQKNQVIICNDQFNEKMQRRKKIVSMLNQITCKENIQIKYQPILDMKENAYTRAEALFCLQDDDMGTILPEEFIAIAEENGAIVEIGYVLLDKVCCYISKLREKGKQVPKISIDFSRQQLVEKDVEERIKAIMQKYEIGSGVIAIELQENVFSVQYEAVKSQILKLHALGIDFYLDGFGTGLLNFSHLIELPFEVVKINKKMIREAEANDSIYLLVSAMVAVFEENSVAVLGDGIETEHLKEIADMLFVNYLQGDYLCESLLEEKAEEIFMQENILEEVPDFETILTDSNLNMELYELDKML